MMETIIGLLLWAVVMFATFKLAQKKKRHVIGWTIGAFLFSLLALIVLFFLPAKTAQS